MSQILRAFARWQHDRVIRDAVLVEAPAQRREVMACDLLVGDDDRLPSPQQRQYRGAGGLDLSGADDNVIASLRKRDAQSLRCGRISDCHGSLSTSGGRNTDGQFASAAMTRVVVCSAEPSLLSMTMSASA